MERPATLTLTLPLPLPLTRYHWEREIRLNPQQYWRLPDADGLPRGLEQLTLTPNPNP